MLKNTINGISAGIMISIGGCVYLACENRYVGAVLFTIALLCICLKGYSLYTGKIGFMPEKHDKDAFSVLIFGLLGNIIATALLGLCAAYAIPGLVEPARTICSSKLSQELLQAFIRACFCGVLMYMAVSLYRDQKTIAGILFCVPVFILSGFEHSIANMFYFALAGFFSGESVLYILIIVLGNSAGGMLLPLLKMAGGEK